MRSTRRVCTGESADAAWQWEAPFKPLAVDDPLLLPEREVYAEIGMNWFLDQAYRHIQKKGMSQS